MQSCHPNILKRNLNSITICWKNIFQKNEAIHGHPEVLIFRLQVCDHVKEWKTLYWGSRMEYKANNLAPCTCYDFRLKDASNDEGWIYFKAATEDIGPYNSVMHMTRAVKLGKTSIIRKIANIKSVLLNAENKENKTPLIQAVEHNDLQVLQLLITLGANVNKPLINTKRTPLMIAVYRGHLQAASLLIDKGANISCADINGLNILHYAVDSNKLENVQFTLNTSIDVNLKDNNGWTPLLRAVSKKI